MAETPEPTVFRVRAGRVDPARLIERLTEQGFGVRAVDGLTGFYRLDREPYPLSSTIEHWLGLLYIQQASTGVAAPVLGPRPGERVLDMCAAPGGKTTHMAELMQDRGCLVANEVSESRIRGLLGNVYRLSHTNIFSVAADGRDFPEGALFDRVLVDAPCSGEGTLRRRAGRAPDQSLTFRSYVAKMQRGILDRAIRLTRPGGEILYVTCTFSPEENEAVISEALARHEVDLVPIELDVPHEPGLAGFEGTEYDPALAGAARIYPYHFDSGGLFLTKLRKRGDERSDVGWSSVAAAFPDGDVGEEQDASAAMKLREGAEAVADQFGLATDEGDLGWVMRGGRGWLHSVAEWPLSAWKPGRWRPIALGIRGMEFDSGGYARPTNDLLRWAEAKIDRLDVEVEDLERLLEGEVLPSSIERRGLLAFGAEGDLLGRASVSDHGLRSEIPKARAKEFLRGWNARRARDGG